MKRRVTCLMLFAFGVVVAARAAGPAGHGGVAADETWRVADTRSAPWPGLPGSASTRGGQWQWARTQLRIDGLPVCNALHHRFVMLPPGGLFQGLLRAPAGPAARALGATAAVVPTQRMDCDNASFDLHHVSPGRALTVLDGRVLGLRRVSVANSPLASAQALLLAHFSGDMAFTPAGVRGKAAWLSPALLQRIAAWQARQQDPDEVPDIDGDPFTNAQEHPDTFELHVPAVREASAEVPVLFSLGARRWRLNLLLQRQGSHWLLDDVRYADGSRLSQLLR